MILKLHKIEIEKAIKEAKLKKEDFFTNEYDSTLTLTVFGSKIFFSFIHEPNDFHVYKFAFQGFTPSPNVTEAKTTWGIHDVIRHYFIPWINDHVKFSLKTSGQKTLGKC